MLNRSAKFLASVLLVVFLSNCLDSYITFATSFEPGSQSSEEQEDQECESLEVAAVMPIPITVSKKVAERIRNNFGEKHVFIPERYELPELEPPAITI